MGAVVKRIGPNSEKFLLAPASPMKGVRIWLNISIEIVGFLCVMARRGEIGLNGGVSNFLQSKRINFA